MSTPTKTWVLLIFSGLFLVLLSQVIDGDDTQKAINAANASKEAPKETASEKGKRNCKTLCVAVGGWHKAHGPNQCICRDKDGCTIVFTAKARESGYVERPYNYMNPRTVGKCAGGKK